MSEWVGRSGTMDLRGMWEVVNRIKVYEILKQLTKMRKNRLSFYARLWQTFVYYRFYSFVFFLTICTFLSVLFMVHFERQKILVGVWIYTCSLENLCTI